MFADVVVGDSVCETVVYSVVTGAYCVVVFAVVVAGDSVCETVSLSAVSGAYCVVFEAGGVDGVTATGSYCYVVVESCV